MLRKLGFQKYFVSFRRLFQNPNQHDLQQPRHLNMELLERRLLLSCDTDFSGGVLTISCGAEDDTISVRIDAAGALLLNEVAITGAPSTSNTDEIVIAAGGGDDQITVDQSTGALGPGATDEASGKSEIEVTVDAGAGTDTRAQKEDDDEN